MKKTPNYQLNQWDMTDRIMMQDFNADNMKLDATLRTLAASISAETEAREAADASQSKDLTDGLAKKGNCKIFTTSYSGNGEYGSANRIRITFPKRPIIGIAVSNTGGGIIFSGYGLIYSPLSMSFSWSGNSASWYAGSDVGQLNMSGTIYYVSALYAAD